MSVKVLLVDDHRMFREGLRTLLEQEDWLEVVGEVETGHEAIQVATELVPDIIIMDVAMPDLNGVAATRKIAESDLTAKVLVLSMHSDRRYVTGMMEAGASGYILKERAFDELVRAMEAVLRGELYIDPGVGAVIVQDYVHRTTNQAPAGTPALSAREREVLQRIAEGQHTKKIARALELSVKTIETHRRNIMRKLNIFSVAELTKYAIREGMTSLDR